MASFLSSGIPKPVSSSPNDVAPKIRGSNTVTVGGVSFSCLVCKEPFRRRDDLWQHLTVKEVGVNVFTCLDCGRGFCKERLFRDHECGSNAYGQVGEQYQALSVFCHIIACQECGLFVALVNMETPSWRSYASFCLHSSRSFKKITLYTWTAAAIRFIRSDLSIPFSVLIDVGPALSISVPINCEICKQEYANVDEVEEHILENHPSVPPIQCSECPGTFNSPLRMELHLNEKHGRARIDLTEFLKIATAEEPFRGQGRADCYVPCDLCGLNFLGSEFNSHDCAINYTRRYLLDGNVICCPASELQSCKVDMSVQHPLLVSISERCQRHVELSLRFYIPVIAPKIDDVSSDRVYSCNHCERVFINPSLFQEHVVDVFQERANSSESLKFIAQSRNLLSHFGASVVVSSTGLVCPKRYCGAVWCSTIALERHLKNVHSNTFQKLTMSLLLESNEQPQPSKAPTAGNSTTMSCPICQSKRYRSSTELQQHIIGSHKFVCLGCAGCFVSKDRLAVHNVSCSHQIDSWAPISYCPICKQVFVRLDEYYRHLICQHSTDVRFNELTGEIIPKCSLFLQPQSTSVNGNDSTLENAAGVYVTPGEVGPPQALQKNATETALIVVSASTGTIKREIYTDHPHTTKTAAPQPAQSFFGDGSNQLVDDDDDVMICDPDADAGTSGTQRQPLHGCSFCSKKFYTLAAADEHRLSHESDTGETTDLVLPVPDDMDVYICRQCCLAYELREAYKRHVKRHRRMHYCDVCSAVALNPQHLESHRLFHQTANAGYGCAVCLKTMRSESTLMLHMNQAHGTPLIWVCLLCGMGNSIWWNMKSHPCDATNPPNMNAVVPTAKKKLHFQPREKLTDSSGRIAIRPAANRDVAECAHRTFLGCKETGVACTTCGSILPATSYFLETGQASDISSLRFTQMDELTERLLQLSHPREERYMRMTTRGPRMLLPKAMFKNPVPTPTPQRPPLLPKPPTMSTVTAPRTTVFSATAIRNNPNATFRR